jgi:hypothetical protein
MPEAIRRLVRAGAQDGRKADGKIEGQDEAAMTKHGTKDHDPAVKARAEALFRLREEQKREGQSAMDDYMTKQGAERAKTVKLRELRLAAEAKATSEPKKAKRKPAGKGKR